VAATIVVVVALGPAPFGERYTGRAILVLEGSAIVWDRAFKGS
jgi:hypothetical protein